MEWIGLAWPMNTGIVTVFIAGAALATIIGKWQIWGWRGVEALFYSAELAAARQAPMNHQKHTLLPLLES